MTTTQSQAGENRIAAAGPRYRRRHWWIDSAMQGRYFVNMLIIAAVVVLVTTLVSARYFLYIAGHATGDEPLLKSHLMRAAVEAALVAGVILPLASVFMSHRFAGPAYRLRKAAQSVAEGDLGKRIHLRRYDHLKPVAAAFNEMVDQLEKGRAAREENQTAARQAIGAALSKLKEQDEAELPEALRLLEEAQARLK